MSLIKSFFSYPVMGLVGGARVADSSAAGAGYAYVASMAQRGRRIKLESKAPFRRQFQDDKANCTSVLTH